MDVAREGLAPLDGLRPALAHTPNAAGKWHLLADHLRHTAELAGTFAAPFGAADLARAAAWLHDAGKCSSTFAAYLQACHAEGDVAARSLFPSRDHKTPGAVRAVDLHPLVGPLVAATILGHHGGIPDLGDVRERVHDAGGAVTEALARFDAQIGDPPFPLAMSGPIWLDDVPPGQEAQQGHARDVEMLVRLVFSALVDADFLDTAVHFDPLHPCAVDRDLGGLSERFESRRHRATDTSVNRARTEIYNTVRRTATLPPGLYSLAAPTGAGKTQIGLGWALRHAEANGLRRVVTAVPFITVTDQVASEYRRLLDDPDDEVVLEHHSEVVVDDWRQKISVENWDSPVVVTTTVRLFESLFSNRPSACRRLHRLARSVIVLDEAQAIPVEVLDPVVDALRVLVDRCGSTVLVMTATQPAIEHVRSALGRRPHDLLPDHRPWSSAFRRTQVGMAGLLTHAEVAERVGLHNRCLCVVNTIRDAREITRACAAEVLHLSTMLRPVDRRARLDEIRRRLANDEECRVVSTQLVEAGVDLDFPVVLRAMAPLPSLAQAAGRCNRNGALAPGSGRTEVFELDGGGTPSGAYYHQGTAQTLVVLQRPGRDPLAGGTIAEWYELFLTDPSVRQDARDVQGHRAHLRYRTTAERFRMIDDDTVSVVVPYPPDDPRSCDLDSLLDRMRCGLPISRSEVRRLQRFVVSLRRPVGLKAERYGLAERVSDHLLVWRGRYDDQVGLVLENRALGEVVL